MDILYYGELDPYSGVDQNDAALPVIIEELTMLLLTCDVVIVPPENLFDHRLALPAFEALAPFVRAGRLTTTADRSLRQPRDLVDQRAALSTQHPSPRQTVAWHRRRCLAELIARWYAILPDTWTLQRDVGAQVNAFARHLQHRCENQPARPGSRLLRETVDHALQSGASPSRSALLARMAIQRRPILPRELAEAALTIQMAYFDLGARTHRVSPSAPDTGTTCRLFPGRFARFLAERGLERPEHLAFTYDRQRSMTHLHSVWQRLGVDPARWTSLAPEALFEIAASPEWGNLRSLLRDAPDAAACDAVAAVLSRAADLRDTLPHLHAVLPHPTAVELRPAPIVLPSEWQLAVQATMGTALPAPAPHADFTLDLRTRTMTGHTDGRVITLRRAEAYLVTLLVLAGQAGLTLADIKQHRFELDRLDSGPSGVGLPDWVPQARESENLDRARLRRINVLENRTNRALAPFDLHIAVTRGKGLWHLVGPAGGLCTVRLEGSLWSLLERTIPGDPPPGRAGGLTAIM